MCHVVPSRARFEGPSPVPKANTGTDREWLPRVLAALLGAVLLPLSSFGEEPPAAPRWSGNVNLFLGVKALDGDDWDPVDRQAQGGVLIDVKHRAVPFSVALDVLYSRDEEDVEVTVLGIDSAEVEVVGETLEVDLGIRKIWEGPGRFRPFLGGGLAIVHAEIKASGLGQSASDEDTVLGVWLDTGFYVTLGERWNLGIDGRWSWAKADLLEVENADAGGWHLGALLGAHF